MSGFFTLGIGRVFHVETLTLSKLIAVTISFGRFSLGLLPVFDAHLPPFSNSFTGVLLVSLADTLNSAVHPSDPPPVGPTGINISYRMYGDALALLSAFFYALYVVLLKVRIGEEARVDMQLFFGLAFSPFSLQTSFDGQMLILFSLFHAQKRFVGLFNTLLLWPIGAFLHLAGWETFEFPTGQTAWLTMLSNMFITLVSDYLYVIAVRSLSLLFLILRWFDLYVFWGS